MIVHKLTPGMDPRDVTATTYQMRNFYRQLGDGFFSVLDTMNYIQHQQIVHWASKGVHLLDVCCGRGLLLPMLRYYRKNLGSYTGVDLEPKNASWRTKRVTDGKPIRDSYYPFPVRFVEANVATMATKLPAQHFGMLVYTSSIEHMQPEDGFASLEQCRQVACPGASLIITCPNTPEHQDGYDTQYAAHVYEWKRSELHDAVEKAGWEIITEWGLLVDKRSLLQAAEPLGLRAMIERLAEFVPSQWLLPVFAPMFPRESKEIGIIAKAV